MNEPLYLITFYDSRTTQHTTVKVREIADSGLGPMFVRISGFVFEESRIVDPVQEQQAARFTSTRAFHLNRMSVVSVEELSDTKVSDLAEMPNVVQFRGPEN